MYLSCDKQTVLTMEIKHLFSDQDAFLMAEISFKVAVITSAMAKITFIGG